MRFASLGGSNAGNYAAAGKAVADSSAKVFDVQRKTGPDYAELSKVAMKTQAAEKIVGMQTAAQVTKQGIQNLEDKTKMQHALAVYDNKKDIFNSKRKAGFIAGLGKLGGAAFLASRNDDRVMPTNSKEKRALLESSIKQQQDISNKISANEAKGLDDGDALINNSSNASSSTTGTGDNAGKVTTGGSNTSLTGTGFTGTTLTGNEKTVADAIAKYESGDWGYEAFNQGGSAAGTRVLGKSGNHKNTFGTSLTDMTLSDIFHRQNTKQRGLSMQQHLDQGGLHAVGRYQFIGSTLQDEVSRMGLDPSTTKFTPEVQDQIFLSHVKRVGNISPWVGPMQHYSSAQRNQFNNMIQGL